MALNMDSILGVPSKTYDYVNDFGMNVYVLGILVMVLLVYYVFFSKLVRDTITGEKNAYARMLEVGLWAVFIVLVLVNGMQYFFNINFGAEVSSLFSSNPKLDVSVKDVDNYDANASNAALGELKPLDLKPTGDVGMGGGVVPLNDRGQGMSKGESVVDQNVMEDAKNTVDQSEDVENSVGVDGRDTSVQLSGKTGVFHVKDNNYTYGDSKRLCKAYGARLATYNEVEEAYNDGAEWCSYGWSDSQMVLYPTQKKHWDKLQTIKGHENDCGRPGVNGGYIDNENATFGVNCFGKRPEETEEDKKRRKNTTLYPKTKEEVAFERDVERMKKRLPTIEVAPFNHKNWHP